MAIVNVLTDVISVSYSGNGKVVSSKSGTYTGKFDAGMSCVVLAGAVNTLFTIKFPFATIQSLIIATSQVITIKTNSTGSPGNTLVTTATAPILWAIDFLAANPLTADVTALYLSNAGAVDATFDLRVLYN